MCWSPLSHKGTHSVCAQRKPASLTSSSRPHSTPFYKSLSPSNYQNTLLLCDGSTFCNTSVLSPTLR